MQLGHLEKDVETRRANSIRCTWHGVDTPARKDRSERELLPSHLYLRVCACAPSPFMLATFLFYFPPLLSSALLLPLWRGSHRTLAAPLAIASPRIPSSCTKQKDHTTHQTYMFNSAQIKTCSRRLALKLALELSTARSRDRVIALRSHACTNTHWSRLEHTADAVPLAELHGNTRLKMR